MYSAARRSDGSIVAWGDNSSGQCNVLALPAGLAYAEIAAGDQHVVARRTDGSVVAWGDNDYGQCNVPALSPGLAYVEVAASDRNSAARRSDGSVVVWGDNSYGQCNVPALPPGITYVEVASGYRSTLARRSDGSVVAWGDNGLGQCNVPALPPGLAYVEISAGAYSGYSSSTAARRSDGTVVSWGDNRWHQGNVPALAPGQIYQEISAGGNLTVARVGTDSSCPTPTSYCIAAINSIGKGASIGWQGSTSIEQNDFALTVSNCPPHKPGVFFFGCYQTQIPFGEGYLCVTGNQHRLHAVHLDATGSGMELLDFFDPSSPASLIQRGSQWNFQFWYRDPQPVGHGFNLSNALQATFCP
jgi:ribosomal protein L14